MRWSLLPYAATALFAASCATPPPLAPEKAAASASPSEPARPSESAPPAERAAGVAAPADVAAPPEDAQRSPSGLVWKRLVAGTGTTSTGRFDRARVAFTAWTPDGRMFETSERRGGRSVILPETAIPGVAEALSSMVRGEKRRLWIPEALAYKDRADGPKGPVVFDLEVREVIKVPRPFVAPEDVASPPPDAVSVGGIRLKRLSPGTGKSKPGPDDIATAHFTGWSADGRFYDSTVQRGAPVELPVKAGLKGWAVALQQMVPGEKARVWIPESLAFEGSAGRPRGTMVFDIELISFVKAGKGLPPPKNVRSPPKSAARTASGIAHVFEKHGQGAVHPTEASRVRVHYTGWTTDGKMFDSSVTRGKPAVFALDQVIPGWTEAVQLMVAGDKALFWIPERLAYQGQPGAPQGMLVFEIELLDVLEAHDD